jgi:hypothetical protein
MTDIEDQLHAAAAAQRYSNAEAIARMRARSLERAAGSARAAKGGGSVRPPGGCRGRTLFWQSPLRNRGETKYGRHRVRLSGERVVLPDVAVVVPDVAVVTQLRLSAILPSL